MKEPSEIVSATMRGIYSDDYNNRNRKNNSRLNPGVSALQNDRSGDL